MKEEEYDYIMTFTSHNRAIYIYGHLIKRKIKVKMVNSPNKMNISCTQAIKFKESDIDIVKKETRMNNIYPTAIYKITKKENVETYDLVE